MIKFERVVLPSGDQWSIILEGMRNPMNAWDKIDSTKTVEFMHDTDGNVILSSAKSSIKLGENDLDRAMKLSKAGTDHRKFMRMIPVYMTITSHHAWWAEFDTYKVGTVRNSCSKMHRIHIKEFVPDDFSIEGIEECGGRTVEVFLCVMNELERLRRLYNETNEKKYWRAIIELLPIGYNIKATVKVNYEVLANIYKSRKHHKLDEWKSFCRYLETLPYSQLITEAK